MHSKISVVIPIYNEEGNIINLIDELIPIVDKIGGEIIIVDDNSNDASRDLVLKKKNNVNIEILLLEHAKQYGQSAGLLTGIKAAKNDLIVTLDGDGQNDPADIASMVALIDKSDAVFGFRKTRKDTWDRRLASKIANAIRRAFVKDGIKDTGCSLKVFRREMVQYLPPFNGLHRFMGAFFVAEGFRIVETPVNHRPRVEGISKYNNLDRALRGIYDLIGVSWYLKRKVNTTLDAE